MSETWVPSLREYAAWYQINGRRLTPSQVLMHPGPVNRGVELSGEVVDSPQAVITAQVEAGVVVRMAVLYELLAAARPEPPAPGPRRHEPRARAASAKGSWRERREPLSAAGCRGRPRSCCCATSTCSTPAQGIDRRLDVRVRGGRDRRARRAGRRAAAEDGGESRSTGAGACACCRPSSTPTSTCAPPARSTRRTSTAAPAPPPPAATAA